MRSSRKNSVVALAGLLFILYAAVMLSSSRRIYDITSLDANTLLHLDVPSLNCNQTIEEKILQPGFGGRTNEFSTDLPQQNKSGSDMANVVKPSKLMTFRRNAGRLNNQWFSLVAAITTATAMNRTLIIPPEIRPHTLSGMFKPELGWWDVKSLFETYDIVYATEDSDPRLNVTDPTCIADHRSMMGNMEATIKKFDHCPNMDIGNQHGLLQCKQHNFCGNSTYQRMAFEVYKHFKPGPVVRNILDKLPHYRVAVHSRTHGGPDTVSRSGLTICHDGLRRTANANYKPPFNMEEVFGQCAFNDTLRYLIPNEPFLLAHDGLLDFDTHYGERAVTVSRALQDAGVIGQPTGMLAAVVELFSMVRADVFYGMIYSTFAISICMLRGEEKKYDSNVCWGVMHPDSEFAEPPKSDYRRIGCMVPVGGNFSSEVYNTIHATWGKRCDVLRFFADPSQRIHDTFRDNDDVVVLPMMRHYDPNDICGDPPCRHLWEKSWRMWLWVADNVVDKADYFLKLDTDTYFFPDNTREYTKTMLPEADFFGGHELYHTTPSFLAGGALLFSRGSIRKLAGAFRTMPSLGSDYDTSTCADQKNEAEDIITAVCAADVGIRPTPLRDEWKERVLVMGAFLSISFERESNKDFWYWKNKPAELQDGADCCSDSPIAFHNYKQADMVFQLEESFYGEEILDVVTNEWPDTTNGRAIQLQRDYFTRVRQNLDRSKRVIVSSSNQVNAQVFLALCYYMPFDDLVCDPSKAKNRVYQAKFQKPTGEKPKEAMIEAERWAHHRQPWIVDPKDMAGNLEELFPKVRPYKVVIIDEGSNLGDNAKHRFGKGELLILPKTEFLEKEKCIVAMRTALYHWEVPYSREAVVRACSETQAGQMTTKMLDFLGDEAALISVKK